MFTPQVMNLCLVFWQSVITVIPLLKSMYLACMYLAPVGLEFLLSHFHFASCSIQCVEAEHKIQIKVLLIASKVRFVCETVY
jgi:hypothetical protein